MDQFDNPVFPADQEFVAGKKGFVAVTDGRLKRAANMLAGLIFYIVNGGYPAGCRRSIPVYDACDRGMDLRFAKEIGLTEVYTDILLKKEEVASGILCTR